MYAEVFRITDYARRSIANAGRLEKIALMSLRPTILRSQIIHNTAAQKTLNTHAPSLRELLEQRLSGMELMESSGMEPME